MQLIQCSLLLSALYMKTKINQQNAQINSG